MLKERIISGLFLATLLIVLIFSLTDLYLIYFVAIISVISLLEFLKVRFSNFSLVLLISLFVLLMLLAQVKFLNILFMSLGTFIILTSTLFILSFPLNKNLLKNPLVWSFSGIALHLAFFSSLLYLTSHSGDIFTGILKNERLLLIFIILVSVLMDSIAFFVGKRYGKRPFVTNVSPNKTLEGFLGAIIITPIVLTLIAYNFLNISLLSTLLMLSCVSFFSVLGDAYASMMKRVIEIKDFSRLIPGHGGLYDRLDSHIAVFPCFVLLFYLI